MLSTLLVTYPWLSPLALAVLIAITPLLGYCLAPRRRVAGWLTGGAVLVLLAVTMAPVQRELFVRCEVSWLLPTFGRVEMAGNVLLFVVPALFAVLAVRRPVLVALAASGLSALIETLQALVPALGRSCATSDWLSNSIGATLGAALGWLAFLFGRWLRNRRGTALGVGADA